MIIVIGTTAIGAVIVAAAWLLPRRKRRGIACDCRLCAWLDHRTQADEDGLRQHFDRWEHEPTFNGERP